MLTDLPPEVTKYGWDKLLSPSVTTTSRYDAQGIMGSGNWYGVPNFGEYARVYYNKDLFAKNGVTVPTTPEEFTAAPAAFRPRGSPRWPTRVPSTRPSSTCTSRP